MCRDSTAQSVLSRRSFDRVFRGVIVRSAIQRDGNSAQLGEYQELRGEWRMRRADELSIVHQYQGGSGSTNVRPLAWNRSKTP